MEFCITKFQWLVLILLFIVYINSTNKGSHCGITTQIYDVLCSDQSPLLFFISITPIYPLLRITGIVFSLTFEFRVFCCIFFFSKKKNAKQTKQTNKKPWNLSWKKMYDTLLDHFILLNTLASPIHFPAGIIWFILMAE